MEEEKETMASVQSNTEDSNSTHQDDIISDETLESTGDEKDGGKSNFHDDSESEGEVEEQSSSMDFEPEVEDNTSSSTGQDSTTECNEEESADEEELVGGGESVDFDKEASTEEECFNNKEMSTDEEESANESSDGIKSGEEESSDNESTNEEDSSKAVKSTEEAESAEQESSDEAESVGEDECTDKEESVEVMQTEEAECTDESSGEIESADDESPDKVESVDEEDSADDESTNKEESAEVMQTEEVESPDEESAKVMQTEETECTDESSGEIESADDESTNKEKSAEVMQTEEAELADEESYHAEEVQSTDEAESADATTQTSKCESGSDQSAADGGKRQSDFGAEPPAKKMKLEAEINSKVPQRIISKFYGRQTELEILQSAINPKEKTKVIDFAITGITGVGKTDLVLKFIYQNYDKFKRIVCIGSKTIKNFQDKFLQLALCLDIIDKEFDITIDDNFKVMLQLLYKELNRYKSLIVFDNVSVEVEPLLPSEEEAENIMFIVTSQISDIQCNIQIELECFDHETAIQMLSDNIDHMHINEPNLQKLATALGYHPFALDIVIKYYEYQLKTLKLKKQEFCVNKFMKLLTSGATKFINFKETSLNSTTSLIKLFVNNVIRNFLNYENGDLAYSILFYVSYMGHKNIDVKIFNKLPNVSDEMIDSAIDILQYFSLVTEQNNTKVSTYTIIQYLVKTIFEKDSVFDKYLLMLQLNMTDSSEGTTPVIDDVLKPQVLKIFNDYPSPSRIKKYGLMFLESSYTEKETNYEKINEMYEQLSKYPEAITIEVQCLYVELLTKCQKYEEVMKITDEIIKINYTKEFDIKIHGLLIWYYRSNALNELKEYEKSWKTCKWTFIRMIEHFDYTTNTLKCLCLLIDIAMTFEDIESYIDYCKNLVEQIIGTYIDWSDTNLQVTYIQFLIMLVGNKFTKSLIKPDISLEFIKNLKSKLEIQLNNNNNIPNIKAITILKFLKFYKCTCLFKLDKCEIAYNKLLSLFDNLNVLDDNTTINIFLIATALFNLKDDNEYKIKGFKLLYLLLINTLKNEYLGLMGVHPIIISIIKCFQCTLAKIGMTNEVICIYDSLEKSEINVLQININSGVIVTNKTVILGRLEKALFICEYVGIDEAWEICTNLFKNTNCPQVLYKPKEVKPNTEADMKLYILEFKKHVESII